MTEAKAALRKQALALRGSLDPAAGTALTRQVLLLGLVPAGATVAGVWPLPGEIDLRPLWAALHDAGHAVLLPETTPRGAPLLFRRWQPGCAMITERFGTKRPDGPVADPDVIFVPLLAFDGAGNRLGYGGGYYDRTLAARPGVTAVGVGYGALRVDSVPVGPHDRPLPRIMTERGLEVDLRKAAGA